MRRMLDPKTIGGGGGFPSSVEFDEEGNRKLTKNLEIYRKLTLKSLVSASNPDGDITKELGGGGKIYLHSISIVSSDYYLYINIYSTSNTEFTFKTFEQLVLHYGRVLCNGFYKTSSMYGIPSHLEYNQAYHGIKLFYFNPQNKAQDTSGISSPSFYDNVAEIL